jgi:hypothetical protein
MRPYLFLTLIILASLAAFAQQPYPIPCAYGCGPYVPLLTTPQISLQTVSPNPVGASNATTGLIAGATNSTLSELSGSTSSVYTAPVWYQGGGAPLTGQDVHLHPQSINREGHIVRETIDRPGIRGEEHLREEARVEKRGGWIYFAGREYSASPATVARGHKPDHVLTNDDITRENDKNGDVKYDGKTEKIPVPAAQ